MSADIYLKCIARIKYLSSVYMSVIAVGLLKSRETMFVTPFKPRLPKNEGVRPPFTIKRVCDSSHTSYHFAPVLASAAYHFYK